MRFASSVARSLPVDQKSVPDCVILGATHRPRFEFPGYLDFGHKGPLYQMNWTEASKYRRRSSGANGGEDWRGDLLHCIARKPHDASAPIIVCLSLGPESGLCAVWSAAGWLPTAAPRQRTGAGREPRPAFRRPTLLPYRTDLPG